MEDVYLYDVCQSKKDGIQSVVDWIDANWEQAKQLDCTHFFVSGKEWHLTASLWMQGMKSPQDWGDYLSLNKFEDAGNGWVRMERDFVSYLYYKNGSLFYISNNYGNNYKLQRNRDKTDKQETRHCISLGR